MRSLRLVEPQAPCFVVFCRDARRSHADLTVGVLFWYHCGMKDKMILAASISCACAAFAAAPCFAAGEQDYEPGRYANVREKARNTLKYAHSPNRLFEKIAAGKMAIGGYVGLRDPQVCEIAGMSGLDYVWIDMEHRPMTVSELMAMQMALEGTGCASLVRVRCEDINHVKPILDIGVDGIIFPQISSYEQAVRAVEACRYPQAGGKRGICVSRATGYGKTNLWDYLKRSETWPLIIIELEDMDGILALDRILTLEHVDAIMVGPSDLSCSLGALRKAGTPEVQGILDDVAAKTRAAGKLFFNIGGYESSVRRGSSFHGANADVGMLCGRWRADAKNGGDPIDELRISLFDEDIENVAKSLGVGRVEAVARLRAAGITGFDADSEYKHTAEVAAAGLELANIYCFFKFLSADGGRAQCAAVVDRAAKSGAKRIMAVPDKFTEDGDEEAEYARMRDGLRTLVDLAKPRGIDVTIEDFGSPRNPCSRMALLLRFLKDIPELGLTLDSGNFVYAGRGEDIVALMRRASADGRIRHVHLKDFSWDGNREYVTLGDGQVPNEPIVRFLRGNRYRGWITLESPVGEDVFADVKRQISKLRSWCL